MGRVIGLLVVFGVGLFAAFSLAGPRTSDLECPDPPVLAAATHPVALSCIDTVSYEGTTYYIDCVGIHPSRIGERFLSDGGGTPFVGASEIEGVDPGDAFILEGPRYCRKDITVATADSFSRTQAGLLSVPADAKHPKRQARENAPWIVPGKREVPEAMTLSAQLRDGDIVITNEDDFDWRDCYQVQISAPDDELSVWEADVFESLVAGGSFRYRADAFGRDSSGLETLSSEGAEDLVGQEVIVMCELRRGSAFGRTTLR